MSVSFHPPTTFNPQCFFYFFLPNYPVPQIIKPIPDNATTFSSTTQLQEISCHSEEKIILTSQDLIDQGYEQTKKPWTEEQDKLLLKLCRNQNSRFEDIAAMIVGRNAKMCYSRYRRLSYQTRVGWSKNEDQKLVNLVEENGDENWKFIATFFKGRTHKQIRDHYINYLKSDINKAEWSLDEDLQLIRLLNLYGKNWKAIEESLPGRSRNQIKNRFFGKITRLNKRKLQFLNTNTNQASLIHL